MKDYTTMMTLQMDLPPEGDNWAADVDGVRDLEHAEEAAMSLLRLVVAVTIAVTLVATTLSVMV
jgi:hypothetical protein